jgi:asparagine N-glycosylation enzyme membrane subunit Stt3
MAQDSRQRRRAILLSGDILVLAVVTAVGFASHGTFGSSGARMLSTFLPLLAGWFMVAPLLGVYDPQRAADLRQVWRPFWAMVLAGPMAALLRGFWLNSPILPVFVVVLGGISALSILGWRLVYALLAVRKG